MKRFSALLQKTSDQLDLPQPAKSRILLEMAGDLEILYNVYRQQGLDEQTAEDRAREKFEVSDEALQQLVQLHRSPVRRWMDGLSEHARSRGERLALIATLLFILLFTGQEVLSTRFFRNASIFVWPVLGLSLGALILSVAKVYKLYIKKDHRLPTIRAGLPSLLMLGCGSLFLGSYGFFVEFPIWLKRIAEEGHTVAAAFANWLVAGSATMIVSLFAASATALVWFVLISRVRAIEDAELSVLLED